MDNEAYTLYDLIHQANEDRSRFVISWLPTRGVWVIRHNMGMSDFSEFVSIGKHFDVAVLRACTNKRLRPVRVAGTGHSSGWPFNDQEYLIEFAKTCDENFEVEYRPNMWDPWLVKLASEGSYACNTPSLKSAVNYLTERCRKLVPPTPPIGGVVLVGSQL